MRDISRMKKVIMAIADAWGEEPDMRYTQLIENIVRFGGGSMDNFFFIEDEQLIKYVENYEKSKTNHYLH